MTDDDSGSGRRTGLPVVVAALLTVLVAVVWLARGGSGQPERDGHDTDGVPTSVVEGDIDGAAETDSPARVRGRVWLEVPAASADPSPDPFSDSGGTGLATDDGGEPEPDTESEPIAPPEVTLVSPEPGSCLVRAWQDEVLLGESTCHDDGTFEVALEPGRFGPTSFEVLVPGRLRAVLQVDVPQGGLGRLPEVALGVAQTVVGQVIDGRGEPIAGALLAAMPWPNLEEPEPWRTRSDAAGVFVFDTVPPGPLSMRVTADGFAASVVETIAPADEVLVVLGALIDLRGHVVGDPEVLARTRVRLEGSAIWPAIEVEVEPETGAFVFESIPDGIYALEAVAPSEDPAGASDSGAAPAQAELASYPLENVSPDLAVTLALGPAVRANVRVVDPDGTPVAGARITLSNASVGLLARIAATDDAGVVAMGPVVPGPYVLRAEADGFLPAEPLAVTLRTPTSEESGESGEPGELSPVYTLVLLQPGGVTGVVVDELGRPVSGASVGVEAEHLHTPGEGEARARMFAAAVANVGSLGVTTGPVPPIPLLGAAAVVGTEAVLTDQDGTFDVAMLTPGTYRLTASHGHFAASDAAVVTVAAGRTRTGVRLILRTGFLLSGRVTEGNARPVAGVEVQASDGSVAWTDDRGTFALGRRRGSLDLVFRRRGFAPQQRHYNVRGALEVEVELGPADGVVRGRIEGENGEVIVDARVTLRPVDGLSATRIAWTDARGLYRFEDVPPGGVELEVEHRDHSTATTRVEVSDSGTGRVDPTDVAMQRGWGLDVEVLADGAATRISGAHVVAGGQSGTTDDDGNVALSNLSGDSVRVAVSAAEYGPWRSRVTAPKSGGRVELRVVLSQGGSIVGRVTDYRGDAVPNARVAVHWEGEGDGLDPRVTHTDAEGRFSAPGLPAGDYEVRASPPAARNEELAPDAQKTDVLRGHVTRGVQLRFDRQ